MGDLREDDYTEIPLDRKQIGQAFYQRFIELGWTPQKVAYMGHITDESVRRLWREGRSDLTDIQRWLDIFGLEATIVIRRKRSKRHGNSSGADGSSYQGVV